MKIGILPNIYRESSIDVLKELESLIDNDTQLIVSANVEKDIPKGKYTFGNIFESDVVITLGGDGTFIKAARQCAEQDIPILGVNLGHLGFLAEADRKDIAEALKKIIKSDYKIEERMMIEVKLVKDGQVLERHFALNDAVFTRKSLSRMVGVTVKVNELLLDEYFADGIIIATPTGSTAYSLSAGGPILDPSMSMMIVTPICPHTLHSRSIAISDDKVITLEPNTEYNSETIVSIDGQLTLDVKEGIKVEISRAKVATKLIKLSECSFYELLRRKLSERGVSR